GTTRIRRKAPPSVRARSSSRPRGSSPSTSCPSHASRRTDRRGGPCRVPPRGAACARPAPGRPHRRTCAADACDTARAAVVGAARRTPVAESIHGQKAAATPTGHPLERIACALVRASIERRASSLGALATVAVGAVLLWLICGV